MILFGLWILLILIGWLWRKNKLVTFLYLAFMIIAIGFRTQGADYLVYKNEYLWAGQGLYEGLHYLGYYYLERFEIRNGIPFETHLRIMAVLSVMLYHMGISKMTDNINIVYALFLIYPFAHETVQTRTFLSDALIISVLPLLLREHSSIKEKRRDYIMFFVVASIAMSMHFLAAIYVAFAILYIVLPQKNNIFKIGIGIAVVYILIEINILPKLLVGLNNRIAYWLSAKTGIGVVIPIGITLGMWYLTRYTLGLMDKLHIENVRNISIYDIQKFNDYVLFLIPLFAYDITFNRLWRIFLIIQYVCISKLLYRKELERGGRLAYLFCVVILESSIVIYESAWGILVDVIKNNALLG